MTLTDRAVDLWPPLAYAGWRDPLHAVHMWTQVVGKIRLALTPLTNHWWNSTLCVTPRGLTTAMIPSVNDAFQIDYDFVDHELVIVTSRGGRSAMPLLPMSVAHFYQQVLASLAQLGVPAPGIRPVPAEGSAAVPFLDDLEVRPYGREMVQRFQAVLIGLQFVFDLLLADLLGTASPAHPVCGAVD